MRLKAVLVFWVCTLHAGLALAMPAASLETRFSKIVCAEEQDLSRFSWRMSGRELSGFERDSFLITRVDDIVIKVQSLLEIYPENFHVAITVSASIEGEAPAHYHAPTKTIFVDSQKVTDGVLAHEIAHAVIDAYFPTTVPEKMQEVLAQYVDRHLWGE